MNNKILSKIYEYYCATLGVGSVLFFSFLVPICFFGFPTDIAFPLIGIGTGTLTPFAYIGGNKIIKKARKRADNENNFILQFLKMLSIGDEESKELQADTINFQNIIDNKLSSEMNPIKLEVGYYTNFNINQFLYLINANYYSKIKDKNFNLTREELMDKVLGQLIKYMKENPDNGFSYNDAKKILDRCSFIDKEIKREIVKEYKNGKLKFDGETVYTISCDEEIDEEKININNNKRFDINNNSDYSIIIDCVANSYRYNNSDYTCSLNWDIDSLKEMMQMIIGDYGDQIKYLYDEYKDGYSDVKFVTAFVVAVTNYALKNKKEDLNLKDYFKAFEVCNDMLPISFKLEILNDVKEKMELVNNKKLVKKIY